MYPCLFLQVVILNSKPAALDDAQHRSAMELSILIDEADQRRNVSGRGRKTSMMAWETTLEDVMEDEDAEESEEEDNTMEGTVLEKEEEEEEEKNMEEEQKVTYNQFMVRLCQSQAVVM